MATQKYQCIFVLSLFYLFKGSYGVSDITYSVMSTSIGFLLRNDQASLVEITYSVDASSSVILILRFPVETYSTYTINNLKANTPYTFNITMRVQGDDVNESAIRLTTLEYGSVDDDERVHAVYLYLTIVIGTMFGISLIILFIMTYTGCCCTRQKPRAHNAKSSKSSIVQRMRKRQRDRDRQLDNVPSEDITNYTNSIPGWNAK
ncbi:uncharacterized protein [Antedon mediterranea]|uniref:uncharacterized protein n=1 Tax=Antedon mediterranea TaxID=105859 RepID=UPI003AF71F3D